tara:strand:- start:122 stop:655 length:534 start_codon:yes stop_codon:yes gene_type:complete
MSRVAKNPVKLPSGVELKIDGRKVSVKGSKGNLEHEVHEQVDVSFEDGIFTVKPREESQESWALAGTTRAVVNNMVTGVSEGFERKLVLNGVGYRAQAQGKTLNLTLGFSHPVAYQLPDGITIETPTQTEIVVKGIDKQLVGQVAANVRGFRPPEPYKGKGVRYADEQVRRKEAKKK